MIKGGKRL